MPPENRLLALRTRHGMSRAELARRLNVDQVTVYRWEHFRNGMDDDTKIAIASLLGVRVNDLMCWPDETKDAA